jgi:NADPH-dependent glutamate synthase beta subunit-like oxidoreductase/NAD(P)H-flavin reductase
MPDSSKNFLNPDFGYSFSDLFEQPKLEALYNTFLEFFNNKDPQKFSAFKKYSDTKGYDFKSTEISQILIDSAPYLSLFIGELFDIEAHLDKLLYETKYEQDILIFKKDFVQKEIIKKYKSKDPSHFNWDELDTYVSHVKSIAFPSFDFEKDEEKFTAKFILDIVELEKNYRWFYEGDKFAPEGFEIPPAIKTRTESILHKLKEKGFIPDDKELNNLRFILQKIKDWFFAKHHYDKTTKSWISYFDPQKTDYDHLVEYSSPEKSMPNLMDNPHDHFRQRDGFKLNDVPRTERQLLNQVDYCMYCHEREKDSCSKGLTDRLGEIQANPLGNILHGCPLEEKISEAHLLRKQGLPLAAFSLIMIDNPMCPGTGHRICNFCMKGCIFQKQEPVNIPLIESSILREILALPYGFEIYHLLTKWNPLNVSSPYEKPYNGKNILVSGLGPAGYTLSQYLLNDGFSVTAIEGLKVEPIFEEYTLNDKSRSVPKPVKFFFDEIHRPLNTRVLQGFGGVSEYGITVRWNKNFLSAIYLSLCRRKKFKYYDGIRFGGAIDLNNVWSFGFDHVALTSGAAKPTVINVKNNLIKGVRKSSDFLMALQLSGAQKSDNFTSLQVQLPAVVIGGGLTAIDCSTELLAYYTVQVEKTLTRYEEISTANGDGFFWKSIPDNEKEIIKTFIDHAKLILEEKELAEKEEREPDITSLLRNWGGVKLIYRKRLNDAPSYRENHEEIIEALEQGVQFIELLDPVEFKKDSQGGVEEVLFEHIEATFDEEKKSYIFKNSGNIVSIPAKTVIVAAGTKANIIYDDDHPTALELDKWGKYYNAYRTEKTNGKINLQQADDLEHAFFTSYNNNGKFVSFFGDTHPFYHGTVVTAMASAMKGAPKIAELFQDEISKFDASSEASAQRDEIHDYFSTMLDANLKPRVHSVTKLTDRYTELIINAPLFSDKFSPGQFFNLRNYEVTCGNITGTKLTIENLALFGCNSNPSDGTLTFIIDSKGPSSVIASALKEGDKIFLAGPGGSVMSLPENQTIILAGEDFGNPALFPLAKALKDRDNTILMFAYNENSGDAVMVSELEDFTDQIVWCYTEGGELLRGKNEDLACNGRLSVAMKEYVAGNLGKKKIEYNSVSQIFAIGSPSFLEELKSARTELDSYFNKTRIIVSVNSPMQCMMKGVCAECMQRIVDPLTGKERFIYSCAEQFGELDALDLKNLKERLAQNSASEMLNKTYFDLITKDKSIYPVK